MTAADADSLRNEVDLLSEQMRQLRAHTAQLHRERDEARAWAQAQANGLYRSWQLDGPEPDWLAELPPVESPLAAPPAAPSADADA